MQRFSSKERIGVYKLGLLISENSNWIFREQPLVDIGIDAFIEQAVQRKPSKFIACQIKAGDSNYYFNKNKQIVTYYISNTHHDYWLSLEFPVILFLVSDSGKIYWGNIVDGNIEETDSRWKIDIPLSQYLNKDNINQIFEEVLNTYCPQEILFEDSPLEEIEDLLEESKKVSFAIDSLRNLEKEFVSFTSNLENLLEKYKALRNSGLGRKNKKVIPIYNKVATQFNILGIRINGDIRIISQGFSSSLIASSKLFLKDEYISKFNSSDLDYSLVNFGMLSVMFNSFSEHVLILKDGLLGFPNMNKNLKTSKIYINKVLNVLEKELIDISSLSLEIVEILKKRKEVLSK